MTAEQIDILKQHNITATESQLEILKGLPLHHASTEFITEIATLCNILYRAGCPVVPDVYYDTVIIAELAARDPNHPFLNQVEADSFLGKTKPLPVPMLSTQKAYTEKAIRNWLGLIVVEAHQQQLTVDAIRIRITPKLDGYAVYDDGHTLYTRGDGLNGTDITFILDHGILVNGNRLPGPGELVVTKSYFVEHLSAEYSNTRNFIGTVLRQQTLPVSVQHACKEAVRVQPFALLPSWTGTITELLDDHLAIFEQIERLVDFDVDGVVLEATHPDLKAALGSTRHHHRWQMAFKRNEAPVQVPVSDVVYQTGKTGVITPVALLEPTEISGVIVSRATAHNAGHIKKWSLGKGSIVEVIRAGLVIPKITGTVRPGTVQLPLTCPSCNAPVSWDNDRLYCSNWLTCPAQIERKLLYFFETLGNCDGFGPATIEILCQRGIRRASEVYALTVDQLRAMGFGAKQAQNLYAALEGSRKVQLPDWRFLAAFGITQVGKGGCELLLKHYPLEDVFYLTEAQLLAIKGFGERSVNAILTTLKLIKPEFDLLYQLGFNLSYTRRNTVIPDSAITGKVIVFTGTMEARTRHEMEQEAKALGAQVSSAVSAKTDYLVAGKEPGSSKIKAAQRHATPVLTEAEYQQLIH